MGHAIQVLVARDHVLAPLPARLAEATIVPLEQGFSMVPLTDALLDALVAAFPAAPDAGETFLGYEGGVAALMDELSGDVPVAYVETEYFGGVGTQGAVVHHGGGVVLRREPEAGPGPINEALRLLGVRATGEWDEFAAVGLFRHRHMDEWEPPADDEAPDQA